jgi:type II secretory pathway pseudopilin PulG
MVLVVPTQNENGYLAVQAIAKAFGAQSLVDSGDAKPGELWPLMMEGVPAFAKYDAVEKHVLVFSGPNASAKSAQKNLGMLKSNANSPMLALENQVDAGGQGAFVWVSRKFLDKAPELAGTKETASDPAAPKVSDEFDAMAFGFGTVDGRGFMGGILQAKAGSWVDTYTQAPRNIAVSAAGDPQYVAVFTLPDGKNYAALKAKLLQTFGEEMNSKMLMAEGMQQMTTGVTAEKFLGMIGPEIVSFSDDEGEFTAARLRDPQSFEQFTASLQRLGVLKSDEGMIDGVKVEHLSFGSPPMPGLGGEEAAALALFSAIRNHVYFMREGDQLIFSATPQALRDRARNKKRVSIANWLTAHHQAGAQSSLLLAASDVEHAPRRTYYAYLGMLNALADLAQTKLNLLELPSADQLRLPSRSSVGLQISLTNQQLRFGVNYDQTPLELLGSSNSLVAVALVGILSAIALPAYQDYEARAAANRALESTVLLREEIYEFHKSHKGRWPNAKQRAAILAQLGADDLPMGIGEKGVITVELDASKVKGGGVLRLTPDFSGGEITWQCEPDGVEAKYVPKSCQYDESGE